MKFFSLVSSKAILESCVNWCNVFIEKVGQNFDNFGTMIECAVAYQLFGHKNHIVDNSNGLDVKFKNGRYEIKAFRNNSAPYFYTELELKAKFEFWKANKVNLIFVFDTQIFKIHFKNLDKLQDMINNAIVDYTPRKSKKNPLEMRINATMRNYKALYPIMEKVGELDFTV